MTQRGETAPFTKTIPSAKILYFQYLLLLASLLLLVSAGVRGLGTEPGTEKEAAMLWTIAVILLVLWALGMFRATTRGRIAP